MKELNEDLKNRLLVALSTLEYYISEYGQNPNYGTPEDDTVEDAQKLWLELKAVKTVDGKESDDAQA